MKPSTSFAHLAGCALIMLSALPGCKDPTSPEDSPYHVTPVSALDPEPTEEMVQHLIDSGTFTIMSIQPKRHRPQSLEDSIRNLIDFAVSKVSEDSATHIPYVWGGKHVDRPTAWSRSPLDTSKPNVNASCAPRVGLDCSGFVQYCFEQVGFGREAPELNVASLAQTSSWDFIAKRGYYVIPLSSPKVSDLLPGDVLIFSESAGGAGGYVHTGIFWSADANINGERTPAFISSAGRSRCDTNYARESRGILTGVVASPLGDYWKPRLVVAIRITEWKLTFFADGYMFFGVYGNAGYGYDTLRKKLFFGAADDTNEATSRAGVFVQIENVTDTGTYQILEKDFDSSYTAQFYFAGEDLSYPDSLLYFAARPPEWWKGAPPPATGGEVKISGFWRGPLFGTVAGTFSFKANSYYSRYEDSTYFQDTVKVTVNVTKYYYQQTEVTGTFAGGMGYIDIE